MSQLKAIIFDYGGTLDTDARHWAHVLYEGFNHAGIPVDEAAFREAYVHGERALAKAPIVEADDDFRTVLLKKVDIETAYLRDNGLWTPAETDRTAAVAAVADYCNAYVERNLATTRRVLDALTAAGHRAVLVSNFYGNIHTILRRYGLDHYFDAVVESAVVGVRKPDPAIYRLGVEATGRRADEVIVVGDSYGKDIVPAKTVGCRAVWLRGEGWAPETVDESLPDAIIAHLAELPAVVERL